MWHFHYRSAFPLEILAYEFDKLIKFDRDAPWYVYVFLHQEIEDYLYRFFSQNPDYWKVVLDSEIWLREIYNTPQFIFRLIADMSKSAKSKEGLVIESSIDVSQLSEEELAKLEQIERQVENSKLHSPLSDQSWTERS